MLSRQRPKPAAEDDLKDPQIILAPLAPLTEQPGRVFNVTADPEELD